MAIGRVFKRKWKRPDRTTAESRFFSIAFPFRGREKVESTHFESESQARGVLRQRLQEIGRGSYAPQQDRFFFPDMVEMLRVDYVRKKNRSWESVEHKIKPLNAYFENWRAKEIDNDRLGKYVDHRFSEGAATATLNGELRYLRRMFRLSCKHNKLAQAPMIELLDGENKRDDCVEAGDFNRLLTKFDDVDVRDLVEFQYVAGWRVGSIKRLEKPDVDWNRETVKLRDAVSKNKQPMLLSFKKFPSMKAVLRRRKEKLRPDCRFIFHRNGRPIKDFRAEWDKATAAAKLTGFSDHGLCRSCAVNLSRAGVPETVASKYMNRKTVAIYKQYRIVDTRDTEQAGEALEKYLRAEKNREKIADISEAHKQIASRGRLNASIGGAK
jgi:site-specific recombinase XerD